MTTINSNNKRILVASDPHQEVNKLKKIIAKESPDEIVVLGDWWDSFHYNTKHDVEATCKFLKDWLFKANFHTLYGNHDLHYLYDNTATICSGYYSSKHVLIDKYFGNAKPAVVDKFKWYIWIDGWLCTHAGISKHHMYPMTELTKQGISAWLDAQTAIAETSLIADTAHWVYGAGEARGGRLRIGGIVWQDFDCEFQPIEEINQLVGHTPHRTILNHVDDGHVNLTEAHDLDIDCHLNEYLIIHNQKLEIKKHIDL
jgi:hypothetical protein